jgi:ABC-2 type transport system ATP-binding protein
MAEATLQAKELSRSYGDFQALKPTDVTLRSGDLAALVGPNGSGKTTLLLCLSGLLHPSSGTIQVKGHDLYREEIPARRELAYVPDVPVFYQELTAWEHLRFMALAHQAMEGFESRAEELLRQFGLWGARNLFPHAYSRGMRLKLGLALALVRPFSVLLLDEPSSALDSQSTDMLIEKIRGLRASGASILLSTHDAAIAERLQAQVWELENGSLHV